MPITQERQTMQDLRGAGFTQQQAEVLAEKLEATAQATQQDLKDFIRQELNTRFAESDNKFAQFRQEINTRFAELGTEMHATQKDLAFKLIATMIAAISLAVAVIKLFPGAH